jgi:hypothetical protein
MRHHGDPHRLAIRRGSIRTLGGWLGHHQLSVAIRTSAGRRGRLSVFREGGNATHPAGIEPTGTDCIAVAGRSGRPRGRRSNCHKVEAQRPMLSGKKLPEVELEPGRTCAPKPWGLPQATGGTSATTGPLSCEGCGCRCSGRCQRSKTG